ncbi:YjgN family protein [Methyloversatilis thermotolerans]|uniref:YjgN family protein n=1 Tax=Methyloversatilis thermotolerans TaxID=1346290 RepID=UPI0003633883|nr:YjgN family protein [Methyloversatilis thermotolerans]
MDNPFLAVAPPEPDPFIAGTPRREPLTFTGRGREYFGIWIVNLVLSVVTLGIYSAWAKVRRLQYFHRNTSLAGSAFDYHGDPRAILKGRIIGLVLLLAYNLSFDVSLWLGIVTLLLLAIVMPRLLMRSLRFRARNTSWRGLRFGFDGGLREAYSVFLLWPVLSVFTAYLLAPIWHQRLKTYQFRHARFGATRFAIQLRESSFYKIYGVALLVGMAAFLLALVATVGVVAAAGTLGEGRATPLMLGLAVVGLMWLLLALLVWPYVSARLQNLVWNNLTLGPHRFQSAVRVRTLYLITFTNLLATVFTLGLFMPFATIRLLRYRIESVTLLAGGPLDDFLAAPGQDVAATGEETADLFDVDIAL